MKLKVRMLAKSVVGSALLEMVGPVAAHPARTVNNVASSMFLVIVLSSFSAF
jgi:hypothetical protein